MQTQQTSAVRLWKVPLPLSRHAFFYGIIGGGKTCKMLTIAQGYHAHGYKIWDMFGGRRGEGPFWSLPNDDKHLWDLFEHETYEFKNQGPKQYRVNLLYPMFTKELPKKLPHNPPNVKSKVFTIPINNITIEDIETVIGETGRVNADYMWETIINNVDKFTTGPDIEVIIDSKLKSSNDDAGGMYRNTSLYKLFLKPVVDNNLISSGSCDLNLDIINEAKEKDVISVLCLDYVPQRFKLFIMAYIQRNIGYLLEKDKIPKKNIGIYREASEFMKIQDSAKQKGDPVQVFRNQITNLARYGRDGFHLFMDSQSPNEVKGMIEGQEDLLCICEMPSQTDREIVCKQLYQDKRITKAQIQAIATLPIHQICIIPRGDRARILRRIQPPRCRYWKEGKGNFYTVWRKEIDKWTDISDDKDLIASEYKKASTRIATEKADKIAIENDEREKNETKGIKSKKSKKVEDLNNESELLSDELARVEKEAEDVELIDIELEENDGTNY